MHRELFPESRRTHSYHWRSVAKQSHRHLGHYDGSLGGISACLGQAVRDLPTYDTDAEDRANELVKCYLGSSNANWRFLQRQQHYRQL